jgi:hypothetical protein
MSISMKLGLKPGTGQRIGVGVGAGASAVAKRAKKTWEYATDTYEVDFDLKKAWQGGENGIKNAKGGTLSKVAGAVRGAVEEGGINVTTRDKRDPKANQGAPHGRRSHKAATRGPRAAKRGSSK